MTMTMTSSDDDDVGDGDNDDDVVEDDAENADDDHLLDIFRLRPQ